MIQGRELGQFVTDFIWYLRNLLLVQSADDAEGLLDMSEENLKQLKEDSTKTDGNTLMRYIRIFSELSNQLRYASQKRVMGGSGFDQTYQTVYGTGPGLCSPTFKTVRSSCRRSGSRRFQTWDHGHGSHGGSPCNCRCTASDIRNTGTDGSSSPGGSYRKSA